MVIAQSGGLRICPGHIRAGIGIMENHPGLGDMRRRGDHIGLSSDMRCLWLVLGLLGVVLMAASHEVIVRHGRTRLRIIGIVDIETSQ